MSKFGFNPRPKICSKLGFTTQETGENIEYVSFKDILKMTLIFITTLNLRRRLPRGNFIFIFLKKISIKASVLHNVP